MAGKRKASKASSSKRKRRAPSARRPLKGEEVKKTDTQEETNKAYSVSAGRSQPSLVERASAFETWMHWCASLVLSSPSDSFVSSLERRASDGDVLASKVLDAIACYEKDVVKRVDDVVLGFGLGVYQPTHTFVRTKAGTKATCARAGCKSQGVFTDRATRIVFCKPCCISVSRLAKLAKALDDTRNACVVWRCKNDPAVSINDIKKDATLLSLFKTVKQMVLYLQD